jgi:pimeloyl-ACP methyl ester carboxylesterase
MHRAVPTLAVLAVSVVLAGCATATSVSVAPAPTTPSTPSSSTGTEPVRPTIDWRPCGNRLECGAMAVPLDHTGRTEGTITLALRRHLADPQRRVGSIVMNPGGPGVPALDFADAAPRLFPGLIDRFDIVAWDPRGVGESDAVACTDDIDAYFALDPTPDTPAEKQALVDAAARYVAECSRRSGRLLPFVGTADTARDLDLVRAALGEDRLTYLGFSYGSEIGATYATLFPTRVRAMVLDGAVDINAPYEEDTRRQYVALETSLTKVLDDCSAKRSCPFWSNGAAGKAFDELMVALDRAPLASPAGRPAVGQGIAYVAVVSGLYDATLWPALTRALAAARNGDGGPLLAMYDAYTNHGDPTWTHAFDANSAVNCLDDPGPLDPSFPDRFADELAAVAPRLGRVGAYGYTCMVWPARAPKLRVTAAGVAGPILLVGTTGDPITPLSATAALAKDLERATLLTVEAEGHTGYQRNACSRRTVDSFLRDLTVPAPGTVCR